MMATRAYSRPWPGRPGKLLERYSNYSENNKVGGKVVLNESAHNFSHAVVTAFGGTDSASSCQGAETPVVYTGWTESDYNRVKAKLAGKLHRGDAAMGMTLASCGQAASMIIRRYQEINDIMGLTRRRRARRALRPRTTTRSLASDVLEVEFGWKPFVEDLFNSMTTLCQAEMPPVRFRAQEKKQVSLVLKTVGEPTFVTSTSGTARLVACAAYSVSNPNVWLLNQLGLLNPVQIAWDRIPWSWVVGMFVNANQLISSFSSTFGLKVMTGSYTVSSRLFREQTEQWNNFPWAGWRYFANTNTRTKDRNRSIPDLTPSLEFRMPNLNWELALIGSALAVQRSRSL